MTARAATRAGSTSPNGDLGPRGRRARLLRGLFRGCVVAAAVWAAAVALLIAFRGALIYPFDPAPASPHGLPRVSAHEFPAADGTPVSAWIAPPGVAGHPTILYFMGNAGNLGRNRPRLGEFLLRGYGLAALEYRGGAGRPGTPGEAALVGDALALYDALDRLAGQAIPPQRRVIYGTSLGTGIAVQLAAARPAAGLVLETPFDRLCRVAEERLPLVPACLLMPDDRYDSLDLAPGLDLPVLILHGSADRVIPLARGRALHDAFLGEPRMIVYEGGRHNDLRLFGAGIETIEWIDSIMD